MKLKINWKELGKQLWDAVKPVLLGAIGGGLVAVYGAAADRQQASIVFDVAKRMVEKAPAQELFENPVHPYTRALLSAIPVPEVGGKKERILLQGEVTSPIDPPKECRFCRRSIWRSRS